MGFNVSNCLMDILTVQISRGFATEADNMGTDILPIREARENPNKKVI